MAPANTHEEKVPDVTVQHSAKVGYYMISIAGAIMEVLTSQSPPENAARSFCLTLVHGKDKPY